MNILLRAAELLEHEATIMRECHTTAPDHDDWDAEDAHVKASHDEMVAIAGELRRMAGPC